MKAVRFHQHGVPEVLHYEDAPDPKIQPNEVLVRVKACALNHLDIGYGRRPGMGSCPCRTLSEPMLPARWLTSARW